MSSLPLRRFVDRVVTGVCGAMVLVGLALALNAAARLLVRTVARGPAKGTA